MNTNRVLELAEHLDKIGEKRPFDFSHVVRRARCGAVGCALWDMHMLWPEEFPVTFYGDTEGNWFPGGPSWNLTAAVMRRLDIDGSQFTAMFLPRECIGGTNFGGPLPMRATRAEVAANMRRIVEEAAP